MLNEINLSRTDLNLLVLFQAVLEERHVGRAARRLSLTPSAVSHGLGRLRRLLNDPMFLRTPKGVVPTARALELAAPILDVLARARAIVSVAEPFDAATSRRAFTIGAPDAILAVLLPPLLARLRGIAPNIDIRLRQLLPSQHSRGAEAWAAALADVESRMMDIAILPLGELPQRFAGQLLYDEDFVFAARKTHPLAKACSLEALCSAQHLVVSLAGDAHGFVDMLLAKHGHTRRVALTVPNFMMALAIIAETDLVGALPRRLVIQQAARFGLAMIEPPFALTSDPLKAITSKAALMDAGVDWLLSVLVDTLHGAEVVTTSRTRPRSPHAPTRRTGRRA